LDIRSGHLETDEKNLARYINGLKFEIQDELNIFPLKMIEEAYKITLKVGEKLLWNQSKRGRAQNIVRGRGQFIRGSSSQGQSNF